MTAGDSNIARSHFVIVRIHRTERCDLGNILMVAHCPAALVLLCFKFIRIFLVTDLPQHGQRGKCPTIAAMSLRRVWDVAFRPQGGIRGVGNGRVG